MRSFISIDAFHDEIAKIAEKFVQKTRAGSTPIRAHNLIKRDVYDRSLTKVAAPAPAAAAIPKSFAQQHGGKLALGIGSIAMWEAGKQAVRDYRTGKEFRRQMAGQQQ